MSAIDQNARLSVAPMMDWTDRHCRVLHRLISRHALLYTEMVTAPAILHGDRDRHLAFSDAEHPVALQLGGSDPAELAEATRIAAGYGYDEINLNCGCPSDRVQSGTFGAVLMKSPDLVARCVAAMIAASPVPVTVKCRIGVDEQEPREVLPDFLQKISDAGITRVAIHARKAWLQGLSPKENRDIPPLDYDLVHEMKAAFPHLHVSINGGLEGLDAAEEHLGRGLDGAMIGRAAYHAPYAVLAEADARIFGDAHPVPAAEEVAREMAVYAAAHIARGGRLHHVTRHMLGLFAGRPGARTWRRVLSEGAHAPDAGPALIETALDGLLDVAA
ncbi:tRNA dihydrouridine(20/20a) synthase DusA [Rhodobacterales bacterium HKCCE3408]|nr:tRNA dihydrouridine(20/20a) synthase DusA [Rhodobacterales bacterium HKCCE3408]